MKTSPKDFVIWLLGFVELGNKDNISYYLPTKANWEKIVQHLEEIDAEDYTNGPTSDFIKWLRGYVEIGAADELTEFQWKRIVEVLRNTVHYEPMIVNIFKRNGQLERPISVPVYNINKDVSLERAYDSAL